VIKTQPQPIGPLAAAQAREVDDEALLQKVKQRIAALPELDGMDVECHAGILRKMLERHGDAMWLALVLVFREQALENTRKARAKLAAGSKAG